MSLLISALIAVVIYGLTCWTTRWSISPDGIQYERMARGEIVASPYHRRVALPWLMGRPVRHSDMRQRWMGWGIVVTILSAVLTGVYVGGPSIEREALAVVLFCGLPGIWRLNVALPVLVDPTAYCLTLLSALLCNAGHPFWGTALALVGASVKETVPVFVAALTLSPWPLLALVVPVWLHRNVPRLENPAEPYLRDPVAEARKVHDFFDWRTKLLPWGVLLVLAPLAFRFDRAGISALIALALGYGQLVAAQDNARLYQWAAPAVILVAVQHAPVWVWPVALLGLFNPYRGT